jgi:hypothetical protein
MRQLDDIHADFSEIIKRLDSAIDTMTKFPARDVVQLEDMSKQACSVGDQVQALLKQCNGLKMIARREKQENS